MYTSTRALFGPKLSVGLILFGVSLVWIISGFRVWGTWALLQVQEYPTTA